jgi:hypothetical protein
MQRLVRAAALGGLFVVLSAGAALAASFTVTLDTSPLSGPQILAFGLTDGDGAVDNTVILSDFGFGGGAAIAGTEDCTLGGTLSGLGCSGNLTSGASLSDVDFLTFFLQQFTAGASLSFTLSTTNNFASGFPDEFAMYVCNISFSICYSNDPTGAMLHLDLTGQPLSSSSFVLNGATDQRLTAPVVTAVPEPGLFLLMCTAITGAALRSRRLRRR